MTLENQLVAMFAGRSTDGIFLIAVLGLMVVSLLTLLGVIQSRAVLGGAIGLAFVVTSFHLGAQYRVLKE